MKINTATAALGAAVFALSSGVFLVHVEARADQATPAAAQTTAQTTRPDSGNTVTDAWITMKVHSQFVPENALEGSDIDVDTAGGTVTLTGTVKTEAGRQRAVAIAKATDGVKAVNDKLRIGTAEGLAEQAGSVAREAARDTESAAKSAAVAVTDGWLKSKIYAQYITEDALDDSEIDIDVDGGVVTLNGTVRTAAGKARATEIARATDGVKRVNDTLRVSATSN